MRHLSPVAFCGGFNPGRLPLDKNRSSRRLRTRVRIGVIRGIRIETHHPPHADGSKSLKVRGSPTRYLVRGPRGRAENCPRTKVTFRWRGPRGGGPDYNRVTTMYLYGLRRATEDCRVYYRPSRSTACHRCAERGLRLQKRNDHAWDVGRRLIGPTT